MENKFIDKIEQHRVDPPRFLYKYYRNLEYARDVLESERLHLDLPFDYNDVFDSARIIDDGEMDFIFYNNQIERIVRFTHCDYKKRVHDLLMCSSNLLRLSEVFSYLLKNNIPSQIVEQIKFSLCRVMRNMQAINNKIICFTQNKKSLLMWAHYADHLKGVCLCFDTQKDTELFSHIYKVDYTRFRNRERNYNFYFNKSRDWAYEKEWRVVIDSDQEYINTKSCVGIIIGERVPLGIPIERDSNGNTIPSYASLSLTATLKNISVYKAKANPIEYKIDIEKHLD